MFEAIGSVVGSIIAVVWLIVTMVCMGMLGLAVTVVMMGKKIVEAYVKVWDSF